MICRPTILLTLSIDLVERFGNLLRSGAKPLLQAELVSAKAPNIENRVGHLQTQMYRQDSVH